MRVAMVAARFSPRGVTVVLNRSRRPRRLRDIGSLLVVTLTASLSLTACGTPHDTIAPLTVTGAPAQPTPTVLATAAVPLLMTGPAGGARTDATEPASAQQPASLDPAALGAEVASLVAGVDGLVEVVVARPDGSTLSEINSYELMEAASLYKLAIMVEVYLEREMGELSFDEEIILDPGYFTGDDSVFAEGDIGSSVTIETLLQTMITLFSNVAATALLARVGNENVNLTMASLGLTSTEIRWSPDMIPQGPSMDGEEPPAEEDLDGDQPVEEPPVDETPSDEEGGMRQRRALLRLPARQPLLDQRADAALNVTTAADIAALYLMLVNGQIVSESVSQEMLTLLEDQQINDRIPVYLPEGTVVAHKTGNLDGLVHDAGVIFAPSGPIVVVVLTENVDEARAIDLIATIARLAYDAGS